MPKINYQEISRFILKYRNYLIALGVSIIIWNITSNPPSGELVLVSNQYIPAGTKLDDKLFAEAHLNGINKDLLISDFSILRNQFAATDIPNGAILNQDLVSDSPQTNNRIDVFISLEQQLDISPGDKIHLWNVDEAFSQIVSQDAVVRRSSSDNYGTELVVSVPFTDEYLVMQSQNIRVTKISS